MHRARATTKTVKKMKESVDEFFLCIFHHYIKLYHCHGKLLGFSVFLDEIFINVYNNIYDIRKTNN